jgi:outer membrane protein assembly factor BamD
VKSGPYSEIAPQAQLRVGAAREKQQHYPEAVSAYERAADRYHDRPVIAADAQYRAGVAYQKQARTAEYDQGAAGKAIDTFKVFIEIYPNDNRVAEAQKAIASLKVEQARGSFQTAQFYEKYNKPGGALVYYNEVLLLDANSQFATEARQRIEAIKQRIQTASR